MNQKVATAMFAKELAPLRRCLPLPRRVYVSGDITWINHIPTAGLVWNYMTLHALPPRFTMFRDLLDEAATGTR